MKKIHPCNFFVMLLGLFICLAGYSQPVQPAAKQPCGAYHERL